MQLLTQFQNLKPKLPVGRVIAEHFARHISLHCAQEVFLGWGFVPGALSVVGGATKMKFVDSRFVV
ncbi:hypothetical protein B9Z07_05505 [Burkholderia cenocepacia]|uniref:Uncharacterized protein n=1 Tax=Burkholderia cenocepacia TaxID=95486 RepID=A0AAD0N7I3_9BURK|nr:hypothetical protein B9Z07_05505 [Burkholderia cenocepacia]PRE34233.1 hypothetical protein C6P63_24920 [Burkholderia cenocepacia]RQU75822.1 hypothetical protein DF049_19750 [Burkholderia cenocepacia]